MRKVANSGLLAVLLAGSALHPAQAGSPSRPGFIRGPVVTTHYDGVGDDLLTAGLGKSGLQTGATAPGFVDPLHPTAAELRRLVIFNNYRALLDTTPGGGYGTFYGPNVTADGTVTTGQGLIAGDETLAFAAAAGPTNTTMMVQVPDSYDPAHGCIVTAPSSGSRGVYGAIGTAGEWGLKHGCAVAYTDKGSGTGAQDLHNDLVYLLQGQQADAAVAGRKSSFTADIADADRLAFDALTPNRFAFKHADSQVNPERDWGTDVLQSITFAFYVLNKKFAGVAFIDKSNTIVIASSVSNGGGASLRAVEQDFAGLIDGAVVGEPNVNPPPGFGFGIVQGSGAPFFDHDRTLIDYVTQINLFAGCAALAPTTPVAPLNFAASPGRCTALKNAGLLQSATTPDQAAESQAILNDFGLLPEQNFVEPSYWYSYVQQAIAVTYAHAYGRFSVLDNLCGYSFGATAAGVPVPLAAAAAADLFATANGIPPTGGVSLINNLGPAGPTEDRVSTPDQDLRGALCLRGLATGRDPTTGAKLTGDAADQAHAIRHGMGQVLASGDLHGTPALIVTGRNDAILPPNFASRAYFGVNALIEGAGSGLRYYEVTNAQHLDTLNALGTIAGVPGFDAALIPLHRYFVQAMDLMYAHLTTGAPLPASQVVHTVPRGSVGGVVPPLAEANVPPIAATPAATAAITFSGNAVRIPQ